MKRVTVLGCGSWGTAIAGVIAENVNKSTDFDSTVALYVRPEMHGDENLDIIINKRHVNPVYLPNFNIPRNVVASSDLIDLVSTADIIALVYPCRYVEWLIQQIKDNVKKDAYFITFCKGFITNCEKNSITLVSDFIRHATQRPCVAVIGATTAREVAECHFTEATIGSKDLQRGKEVKQLLQTPFFRLTIVSDEVGVELFGAFKHVVAIAAGMIDGLQLGDNTKAAVLRLGFWEMSELMKELFPNRGTDGLTIEQSCGMAELFICMSHRQSEPPQMGSDFDLCNILIGKRLSFDGCNTSPFTLTKDQARQVNFADGVEYAQVIHNILSERGLSERFPVFTAVHKICQKELQPKDFIPCLRCHPAHGN